MFVICLPAVTALLIPLKINRFKLSCELFIHLEPTPVFRPISRKFIFPIFPEFFSEFFDVNRTVRSMSQFRKKCGTERDNFRKEIFPSLTV